MNAESVIALLRAQANPDNVAGMSRFGINPTNTLGLSIYTLRDIAKEIGVDHALALELWASGVHEARILAAFIDDPRLVTAEQMESWALDFDSWDVCDQVCTDLFYRCAELAWQKAVEWSGREEEFVKRGGFAIMAGLAWHDKHTPDERFELFFPLILAQANDGRNYVKKAVNWALRNIGKRNLALNARAIEIAQQMKQQESSAARWNASDCLRELQSQKVQARLAKGKKK